MLNHDEDRQRWLVFGVAAAARFMVVLDASIVNVALPSIQRGLHFSPQDLQWVINMYALMFGGFLLLGGRAGDLFGRRRLFIGGLVLFSLASLVGGFAQSPAWLVAARGAQGLGGAIMAPVALSIIIDSFPEGAERNRALGIFGSLIGLAAACGVLLGGILTDSLGWRWILYVNVPVGIAAIVLSFVLIPDSRGIARGRGIDLPGAVTVTAGLGLLVYALVEAPAKGWLSSTTLGSIAATVVLLGSFVGIELRTAAPLVRLGIFRQRTLSVSTVAMLLSGAATFSAFFFVSLYLQNVLKYSPMKTGLAYLPMASVIFVAGTYAGSLVTRYGPKLVLLAGLSASATGLLLLAHLPIQGSYPQDVLPATLFFALGMGLTFVPLNIMAVQGVHPSEIGLASGVLYAGLQIGGALGLAVLSTISTTRFDDLIKTARGPLAVDQSLVSGFHYAFATGAGFVIVAAVLTAIMLPRPRPQPREVVEEEAVA
jgi:EmrB/QacA subfamily drug resistance transporter